MDADLLIKCSLNVLARSENYSDAKYAPGAGVGIALLVLAGGWSPDFQKVLKQCKWSIRSDGKCLSTPPWVEY